ncbi:hypothetical protein L218DRAFT_943100 [Marasmius fiardii PR-910]|nr:hypothetical protein L218DRAFT_943100 [Marasmius fiardii PR-910]
MAPSTRSTAWCGNSAHDNVMSAPAASDPTTPFQVPDTETVGNDSNPNTETPGVNIEGDVTSSVSTVDNKNLVWNTVGRHCARSMEDLISTRVSEDQAWAIKAAEGLLTTNQQAAIRMCNENV